MSYPTSPLEAIGADGAFQIGGGDFKFGQDYNESIIRNLFTIPAPNLGNAIDILRDHLTQLPLEALKGFQGLVGAIDDAFDTVEGAVDAIVDALQDNPIFVALSEFQAFLTQLWEHPAEVIGQIGQDLVEGLETALSNFQTMINQIGDIVMGVFIVPINTAIANFADWFRGLIGWQDTAKSDQINLQNFQISTIANNAPRNPVWVSRHPIGDVTYPEYLNARWNVFGTTDGASTGTAHTHTLTLTNSAYSEAGVWSVDQNESRGSYITVSNPTVIDTVGMNLRKASGTLNNTFLELFQEKEDGSLVRIASVDVSAAITTTLAYVETPIPAQIVQGGERYILRVRNASTVATRVWVQAINSTPAMVQVPFYTATSGNSNKTSYTSSEAATFRSASTIIPWGLIAAVNLAATDQSFSDDFNRISLGGLWSLISASAAGSSGPMMYLAIGGNQLVNTGSLTDGGALFKGAQSALYVRPTAGDASKVEAGIYPGLLNGHYSGIVLHASRTGDQAVVLMVNNGNAKIFTGALTSPTLTERASVAVGGDALWTLYYDVALNTYVALKNGDPIGLSWEDTGNVILHGRDYRYGGARANRDTGFGGAPIDNWTLRDWKPAA